MRAEGFDVAVVGGGPAGMLAAGQAARLGARVLLLEKNKTCGRKLAITGKGRCNLTNDCPPDVVLKNTLRSPRFLHSSVSAFPPAAVMELFEGLGVPLKTERGGRVFPVSDKSGDVVSALRRFARRGGAEFVSGAATSVESAGGAFVIKTAGGAFTSRSAVLSTGGITYPLTGSTGDGHSFAAALGHRVTPLRGSLVRLVSEDGFCAQCAGLTLKNIGFRLCKGGKAVYTDFGELLFTGDGISGPVVLSASAHMDGGEYGAELDLKPALDLQTLDARLLRDLAEGGAKELKTLLRGLAPAALAGELCAQSGLSGDSRGSGVTKEQRRRLGQTLKGLKIRSLRPGPDSEAVVTRGGVDMSEVNPKTMESKLVPGLFFAGEILDADAYTGGFNLQIAFSTGYAAGTAAGGRFAPHGR